MKALKKTLALLLSLAMIFTSLTVTALASETYNTSNVPDKTMSETHDYVLGGNIYGSKSHPLTIAADADITLDAAEKSIYSLNGGWNAVKMNENSSLVLTSTVNPVRTPTSYPNTPTINVAAGAKLVITPGTVVGRWNNTDKKIVEVDGAVILGVTGTVNINGAIIAGTIQVNEGGSIVKNLTSGYFKDDMTAYCADGYKCVEDTTMTGCYYKVVSETDPSYHAAHFYNRANEYTDLMITDITESTQVIAPSVTKDGKVAVWYTNPSLSGTGYSAGETIQTGASSDILLFAKWVDNADTVAYVTINGEKTAYTDIADAKAAAIAAEGIVLYEIINAGEETPDAWRTDLAVCVENNGRFYYTNDIETAVETTVDVTADSSEAAFKLLANAAINGQLFFADSNTTTDTAKRVINFDYNGFVITLTGSATSVFTINYSGGMNVRDSSANKTGGVVAPDGTNCYFWSVGYPTSGTKYRFKIYDGNYSGANNIGNSTGDARTTTVFAYGGTYDFDPEALAVNYVPEGYGAVKDGDKFTVVPMTAVTTEAELWAALTSTTDGYYRLSNDITVGEVAGQYWNQDTASATQAKIMLDFAGHKVTAGPNTLCRFINVGASSSKQLTLDDSVGGGGLFGFNDPKDCGTIYMLAAGASKLVINGGTYQSAGRRNIYFPEHTSTYAGVATINGGTFVNTDKGSIYLSSKDATTVSKLIVNGGDVGQIHTKGSGGCQVEINGGTAEYAVTTGTFPKLKVTGGFVKLTATKVVSNNGITGGYFSDITNLPVLAEDYAAAAVLDTPNADYPYAVAAKTTEFTITYKDGDATVDTATSTFGTAVAAKSGMEKEGFTFTGWNTAADGTGTAVNAGDQIQAKTEATLFAQWIEGAAQTYTVKFFDGDAEYEELCMTDITASITLPTAPEKEDYNFTGWKIGETVYDAGASVDITEDTNVYAQWVAKVYVASVTGTDPATEEIKTVKYESFTDAVKAAVAITPADGDMTIIDLLADIEINKAQLFSAASTLSGDETKRSIILDLNGFTVTGTAAMDYMFGINKGGDLGIWDSSEEGTGKLAAAEGTARYLYGPSKLCSFTILGGTFTGAGAIDTTYGKLRIFSGTFEKDPTAYAKELCLITKSGDTWTVNDDVMPFSIEGAVKEKIALSLDIVHLGETAPVLNCTIGEKTTRIEVNAETDKFDLPAIAFNEITETITVTIADLPEGTVCVPYTFTALDYLNEAGGGEVLPSTEMQAFIADIIVLGNTLQAYSGKGADVTVADWAIAQKTTALPSAAENVYSMTSADGADALPNEYLIKSMTLNITDQAAIVCKFATDDEGAKLVVTKAGAAAPTEFAAADGKVVMLDRMSPLDFDTTYTFELKDASGNMVRTATYSVNSYCSRMAGHETAGDVISALYNLGVAAEALLASEETIK